MKVSYVWLKALLPDLQHSPEDVAKLLTQHSFETVISQRRQIDPKITVVRIEAIEPHPNADRLRIATVSDGATTTKVVCGAPNIAQGAIVPFSPPGTTLWNEEGKEFVLATATIRGVESPGMLNSLRELGLGTTHSGIFILPPETPIGAKLNEHIPDDVTFEADITPNRAHDCLSHIGIAREIAALLKIQVKEPTAVALDSLPHEIADWSLTLAQAGAVRRYLGILVENLAIAASPLWLQARLLSVGSRPVNVLVDSTNYVMFEIGNPAHAFDADQLPGHEMGVRQARGGENVTLLDGTECAVAEGTLVITSADQPVAVAGVMGGKASEVTAATTSSFIEIANFEPVAIQTAARTLSMRTEASMRFSKGVATDIAAQAAERLLGLLQETCPTATVVGMIDEQPAPTSVPTITFRPERVSQVAGVAISTEKIRDSLTQLRFECEQHSENWQVTPPAERLDITGEHDIVEEAIRLHGLDQIPATPPVSGDSVLLPREIIIREAVRDWLVSWGLNETYNYSFAPGKIERVLGVPQAERITLLNPVTPPQAHLRVALLPGLVSNLLKNKLEYRTQRLFEIGTVFSGGSGGTVEGVVERRHLAGLLSQEEQTVAAVAGIIGELMGRLGIAYTTHAAVAPAMPDQQEVKVSGDVIGTFGSLDSAILKKLKYQRPVAVFELDLEQLVAQCTVTPQYTFQTPPPRQYQPLSKYPPVFRDVSVLVAPDVRIEEVQEIIERVGKDLVVDVDLFDVYYPAAEASSVVKAMEDWSDDGAGEERQSMAFHIKYQAPDRTLTDEEVAAVHNTIVASLQTELGAQLRE